MFHCGPPRGFWTPMHHTLGLSWPGEPYPAYTCVHGVVKTESEKSEKSHGLFLKKKINFHEIKNNFSFSSKSHFSMTECLDQVQIDFPIRLCSNYANGT